MKSTTWNVITAVACVMVTPPTLLVPVTVTVKSPVAAALHDRVEVPGEGGMTMLVNNGQVRPTEAAAESATVPVKPFTAVAVIVCVAELPGAAVTVTGADGAIVKSTTWKVITAVACVMVTPPTLLVPVTVTV